jgi:hypothetical protein
MAGAGLEAGAAPGAAPGVPESAPPAGGVAPEGGVVGAERPGIVF